MKICLINASNPNRPDIEFDSYLDLRTGPYFNGNKILKKCISWHSWAYALKTEFFVYGKDKWQGIFQYDGVIILVNRDMHDLIPLVKKLKLAKKKVAIALHEGGQDFQVGSGLGENVTERWIQLYDLVKEADKYITFLPQIAPFFEGWFGKDKVHAVLHTAPFDWEHTFSKSWDQRKYDILIGTRTLNQRLSRNTLMLLGALNGHPEWNVHYRSEDGDITPLLNRIGITNIKVHVGALPYEEWLEFLSNFKCLVHFDKSLNLGQIALDAAMVDVYCVGSTTANNIYIGTDDAGKLDSTMATIKIGLEYKIDDLNFFRSYLNLKKIKQQLQRVFE